MISFHDLLKDYLESNTFKMALNNLTIILIFNFGRIIINQILSNTFRIGTSEVNYILV